MDEPKVAVLRHYASPYYDPQKAHEYYMRTRELKGRSTTSLNDDGKKIWSYTKNNIKSEKAAKVKEEQEKRDQKITELREKSRSYEGTDIFSLERTERGFNPKCFR